MINTAPFRKKGPFGLSINMQKFLILRDRAAHLDPFRDTDIHSDGNNSKTGARSITRLKEARAPSSSAVVQ